MEKIKIQRYVISELIKDNQITGIKYDLSDDGNWVLYSEVKSILEDQSMALHKIDYILKKISDHRDNKNGL